MLYPIKVVEIELSQSIPDFVNLERYFFLRALVRLHGVPLGYVQAPITLGKCRSQTLSKLILDQYSESIICQLLKNGLASPERPKDLRIEDLVNLPPAPFAGEKPLVTVAVCTRDRAEDMKRCLEAITKLDYPHLEILVVDNAPKTEATKELIDQHYPQVRYVREPRPGLDWARNRAILEANGEIIAYTDDDVVVDSGWVSAIAQTFVENPEVMAVTGLVAPYELETEAQVLFQEYGGFGRGFREKWYRKTTPKLPWQWLGAGQFGTGANMAYRRSVFAEIGCFDPALDVGTPTNGGGDLEMFFRVLKSGYTLVYNPKAMIWHRHRREYAQLKLQISFNGSLYALWLSIAKAYPEDFLSCLIIGLWWMFYWNIRRTVIALGHKTQFPLDLILAELKGAFAGFAAYPKAQQQVQQIVEKYGSQTDSPLAIRLSSEIHPNPSDQYSSVIAVREIELSQPLQPLTDLENYPCVRIFLNWHHCPFGHVDCPNNYHPLSRITLARLIVDQCQDRLLDPFQESQKELVRLQALNAVAQSYGLSTPEPTLVLPNDISVSVVVATFDRPHDLRNCLEHLQVQKTARSVEIVVVDNHPESGLTSPVVEDFPDVVLVQESRQGLAYARNAGFLASTGEILIATDDDVTVPSDWLEKLVTPFARSDVMTVTGNVLPLELETKYQQAFENYGGLGRGYDHLEVNGRWYDLFPHKPSPTWLLGATANAAFRRTIFTHPEIGLMDECLGPGMPSGVGEDTYLFYKVIKAGYTIVYEPKAYVWHKHRRSEQALKRQLYGYSKGHVSYNLTTWLRDGDWRGLAQVLLGLPYAHYYRIKEYLLRRSDYPLSLIFLEILGNLAGPWSLWRSRLRVKKEGRSLPDPMQSPFASPPATVSTQLKG
ncbi:MAG: glycosyltransferase [Cyanobacteria bacterium]|jgi:GT2 family glycosyltransferase|nr:glycosyltransferase [Cyanobacteria bacterium GSL.Bin1]